MKDGAVKGGKTQTARSGAEEEQERYSKGLVSSRPICFVFTTSNNCRRRDQGARITAILLEAGNLRGVIRLIKRHFSSAPGGVNVKACMHGETGSTNSLRTRRKKWHKRFERKISSNKNM